MGSPSLVRRVGGSSPAAAAAWGVSARRGKDRVGHFLDLGVRRAGEGARIDSTALGFTVVQGVLLMTRATGSNWWCLRGPAMRSLVLVIAERSLGRATHPQSTRR